MSETGNENKIAVIGMSCRFPGASDIYQYWANLVNGVESIQSFSREELIRSGIDPELIDHPDYIKASALIKDTDLFDASFFGYSPEEARFMDPQQRLFLECCWSAMEHGGYVPDNYPGRIGVFGGCSMNFYLIKNILSASDLHSPSTFFNTMLGNEKDYLTTRVSYQLNLTGPSINVQTACSTSLVAIHLACQNLLNYDCDMALAGGATVKVPQKQGYLYQEGLILSKDGHCRAFDSDASGTVFGEGVGVVLLKRYEDALADKDPIDAVILGSAINNDGATKVGFTAPSIQGQQEAIESAYEFAEIDPESISYIETHGTGTLLGDPIEIGALTEVFKKSSHKHCVLGSVKTNIGHLDAASGIASFIKTVLILKNEKIPPTLHFKTPNPKIELAKTPFHIANTCIDLKNPPDDIQFTKPFRAGVSSFGVGGTNVHVLLEKSMTVEKRDNVESKTPYIFPVSAKTPVSLRKSLENMAEYLQKHNKVSLTDIAYTLQQGRKHFPLRTALIAGTVQEAVELLSTKAKTESVVERFSKPEVTFMFTGQGSQHINMAKGLYNHEPLFRSHLDQCLELINKYRDNDIRTILYPENGYGNENVRIITRTDNTQPLLFAIEFALANLCISKGIIPQNMIGHSIGEYVAAALAGVFTLEQAVQIVCLRSKLMQSMKSGSMLSIAATAQESERYCNEKINLAVINSPEFCVLAGESKEIEALQKLLAQQGVKTTLLKTSHAFHSSMMEPAAKEFSEKLKGMRFESPKIPFISNVTGKWITEKEATSSRYWGNHIRNTVRFSQGITNILSDRSKERIFLEIGPGNTLCSLTSMHDYEQKNTFIISSLPNLRQVVCDYCNFLEMIGRLWQHGAEIDWDSFSKGNIRRCHLPTYPFEGKRYWIDAEYKKKEPFASKNIRNDGGSSKDILNENKQFNIAEKVTSIWKDTLGISDIDETAEFFDLGGNSLIMSQIFSRLRPLARNGNLSIGNLFKNTTLKSQIDLLTELGKNETNVTKGKLELPVLTANNNLPLSSAQERLWFIYKMDPGNISFNLVQGIHIKGKVNLSYLKDAWELIIERHKILRSIFKETENGPVIQISDRNNFSCNIIDLSSVKNSFNNVESLIVKEARKPFDLCKGPLFRVNIYQISPSDTYFVLFIHHIICDGWSMSVWVKELTESNKAFSRGEIPKLDPMPFQFFDYSAWSRSEEEKYSDNKYSQFWVRNFGNNLPILQLPTDYRRPEMPNYHGKIISISLTSWQYDAIKQISSKEKVTTFNILLGMFFTLLYRYSNQDQIIIGCPNANRTINSEIENLIGFFINMIPYKGCFDENTTFKDLLKQLKTYYEESLPYQDIPFAKLVELINPPRITNRAPVFQVMFAFQNYPHHNKTLDDISIESKFFNRGISEYDISLYLAEKKGQISGIFEYSTELFQDSTMENITKIFNIIIQATLDNMCKPLSKIPLFTHDMIDTISAEKHEKSVLITEKTIVDLFESILIQSKTKIACIFGSESITYDQLNKKANRLGSYLRKMGVGTDDLVGIMVDRSIDMLAALLGILKAGGGYVPLDPSFPKERLSYMIEDSGLKVLISQSDALTGVNIPKTVSIITIDKDWQTIKNEPDINLSRISTADNTAYVIYTSGSTGNPKGVVISHKSLVNFLTSMKREPGILPDDIFLAVTTVSFDISGLELFGPLICGARIILADSISTSNGEKLLHLIKENKVTVMQATPATWKLLLDAGWNDTPTLRVFCGGEALTRTLANKMLSTNSQIWNLYGPTETTIWSSVSRVTEGDDEPDIGKPIDNTFFLIVDKMNNPLPDGFYGELCIGGYGLAKEYLHRKDLTKDRFAEIDQIGRVYKTGDLARKRHDGTYEYSGRIDFQVKVNGFRIELGEIENVLKKFSSIKDAIVNVYENKEKNKSLVAYLIIDNYDKPTDIDTYRSFCQKKLPYYMVPQFFIVMEQFPLTANGKIDRKKLPAPHFNTAGNQHRFQKPQTEIEKRLVDIWGQLLSIDTISITDNYFELGGTSLLATKLFSKIEKVFGITLPLVTLFSAPTIKLLADSIKKTEISSNKWPLVVPIRLPKQASEKKPLFLVHGGGGNILLYRELANHLPDDIPVYGIQAQGLDDKQGVLTTIEEMASRYIKEIIKIDPDGPYYLGGYCMGGTIVYEMARQLKQNNREIGIVALFDTYREWFELSRPQKLVYLINNIQFHFKNIHQASLKGKYLFLKERSIEALRRIERKIKVVLSNAAFRLKLRKEFPLLTMENINDSASYRYKAKPYDGIITVFKSKAVSNVVDPYLGWKNVETGGIDLVNLSAYQNGILVSPFVEELAKKLSEKLQQSFDKHSDKTDYVLNGQNKP